MLKLLEMWSTVSLPLLPGLLWSKVVAPDSLISRSNRTVEHSSYLRINDMLNWIVRNRTAWSFNYEYRNNFKKTRIVIIKTKGRDHLIFNGLMNRWIFKYKRTHRNVNIYRRNKIQIWMNSIWKSMLSVSVITFFRALNSWSVNIAMGVDESRKKESGYKDSYVE